MAGLSLRKAPSRRIQRQRPSPAPGAFLQSLPEPHALAMPVQDLRRAKPAKAPRRPRSGGRRGLLMGATLGLTAGATVVMALLLAAGGWTVLDAVTLGLFLILFTNTAFGFVSALAGFGVACGTKRADAAPQPLIVTRTALLMLTYNEDPGRILAAVQAIYEDLRAKGVEALYDLFVLSDTRDGAIARAEAVGVMRMRQRLGEGAGIYYRRRVRNTDRKAGNVAEWVMRLGGGYEYMLLLDADSLMTADTIVRLTARMERDPDLGLLQTAPTIVGGETLFGRLQQFASRTYGAMLAAGQDWWSGAEGNYWGHNAIIRTRAFAAQCGLPHLPGRRPFGGHILSHDFVEAALLRRGGWSVRLAHDLEGSYEEAPPTVLDLARRDRRWCQGNLQHAGVLGAAGLHWVSRLHLLRGILSYLAAPLWLLLLCTGAGVWVEGGESHRLPSGPATWLFGLTMALLLVPKLLGAILAARRTPARGVATLVLSMMVEMVISTLVAPVMMLMQAAAVVDVLLGRDSGWGVQQRDHERMTRREAWQAHGRHVLIGVASACVARLLDPAMFWWTSPVYAGLVLSAPLAILLSRANLGRLLRRLGVFVTPEEAAPPAVVVRAAELRAQYDREQASRWEIERLLRAPAAVYEMAPAQTAQRLPQAA
jgi:membrane glycosyltransferase